MTREFEFKPAPLGKPRRVVLEEPRVRVETLDGVQEQEIRFEDVELARFVESSGRGLRSTRLDLIHGENTCRIYCNGSRYDSATEPPLSIFFECCIAVLQQLSALRPDVEVETEESTKIRWLYFWLGSLALLAGVGLPVAALLTGVRSEKWLPALIPSGILVLLGFFIVAANRPWLPSERVPAGALAETLRLAIRLESGESASEVLGGPESKSS